MVRRTVLVLVGAMAILLSTAAHARAQSPATGTIRGVMLDTRDGTPLRRVSVRLQATNRTTVTDDEGRFVFDNVPAGQQELYVSAVDFILVKRAVVVPAGAAVDVTIVLAEIATTASLPPYDRTESFTVPF